MSIVVIGLDELRALIREELRASRDDAAVSAPSGPAFLARRAYAERVDMSTRSIDALLARGLPHVGAGRLLRVAVAAADAWMRANLSQLGDDPADDGDDVVQLARRNARRAR